MIGTEVLNAANGGYSIDQTVMRTEALLPMLHPSTVLAEVTGITNIYNGLKVYSGAPKPYYHIEDGKLVLYNEPVPRLASGPFQHRNAAPDPRAFLSHAVCHDPRRHAAMVGLGAAALSVGEHAGRGHAHLLPA